MASDNEEARKTAFKPKNPCKCEHSPTAHFSKAQSDGDRFNCSIFGCDCNATREQIEAYVEALKDTPPVRSADDIRREIENEHPAGCRRVLTSIDPKEYTWVKVNGCVFVHLGGKTHIMVETELAAAFHVRMLLDTKAPPMAFEADTMSHEEPKPHTLTAAESAAVKERFEAELRRQMPAPALVPQPVREAVSIFGTAVTIEARSDRDLGFVLGCLHGLLLLHETRK